MLQPIRDGPDNLADRVPVPAHLEALGHGAHNISSQAHASLGSVGVGMGCCRARASVDKANSSISNLSHRDACENEEASPSYIGVAIFTLWGEADPPS